jgi:uncharacterized protein YcsI (UPF0317 family)
MTTTWTSRSKAELPTGLAARLAFRAGLDVPSTVGVAPGFVQANLVVLPRADAHDFLTYCLRNPKPCPLLGFSEPGRWDIPAIGADLDLRTDLPRYRVWRDGVPVDEPQNVAALWRDDLVGFALGCSYSFDDVLAEAGIRLRHAELGVNPPYYVTTIATTPAGRFAGPLIVSMRPLSGADAIRAVLVTARCPHAHGAPVHLGDPAAIGIDLQRPDGGTELPLEAGETPVFWACGVTPETAIRHARPAFCITHMPGAMLLTDLRNSAMALP